MLSVFRLQFREPDRAVSVMAKQKAGQLRGLFIIDLGARRSVLKKCRDWLWAPANLVFDSGQFLWVTNLPGVVKADHSPQSDAKLRRSV